MCTQHNMLMIIITIESLAKAHSIITTRTVSRDESFVCVIEVQDEFVIC
jgi:hypothetical protein